MSLRSVKELRIDAGDSPARGRTARRRIALPWRLIGLVIAFGVSGLIWLALFWAIGYYL